MTWNGNILNIDEADATYLTLYLAKSLGTTGDVRYRAWQSTICQECGETPTPGGYPHVLDADGFVLICCEGYWQINPNMIGLPDEQWSDWHEEIGGLADDAPLPPGMAHLAIACIGCGINKAKCILEHDSHCCDTCLHEEPN